MAIAKRNYIPNDYEEVSGVSLGSLTSGEYTNFKLDGIFSFDVSNVTLYQDGSLVPSTAYELIQDATYTAKEADYSGETLYKMFRITDAAYAGIETTINCYNFGSAVDNELLYTLYVNGIVTPRTELSEDATLTTSTTIYNDLYVFDSLSADTNFVITDGGGDERNKFTVQNDDDTYKILVSGDVNYYVEPGQTVSFYEKDGALVWSSAGLELVFDDDTNSDGIVDDDLLRGIESGKYIIEGLGSSSQTLDFDGIVNIENTTSLLNGVSTNFITHTTSAETWTPSNGNHDIHKVYKYHNGK